jgi:2-oxoglutarate ferredoxin oxidoreductase subunit gamma
MRGGTANCIVIVADEAIGAPLVRNPQAAIVMNLPSLDKFEPLLAPGGTLIVNTSLIDRRVSRNDLSVTPIPATEMAESLGDKRLANMVMLGALLARLPVLSLEEVKISLQTHLPEQKQHLLRRNIDALDRGTSFACDLFVNPLEGSF